jgi:hypothetical protein
LISCGKENKDAVLTPETTKVRGDLKDYFTVVEKSYTVKYDDQNIVGKYMISIELQRTDVPFAFDTKGVEPVGTFGQGVRGNYGIGIDIIVCSTAILYIRKRLVIIYSECEDDDKHRNHYARSE